jgi:lipopolysaccharide export LptBFGC system permease protein LptF
MLAFGRPGPDCLGFALDFVIGLVSRVVPGAMMWGTISGQSVRPRMKINDYVRGSVEDIQLNRLNRNTDARMKIIDGVRLSVEVFIAGIKQDRLNRNTRKQMIKDLKARIWRGFHPEIDEIMNAGITSREYYRWRMERTAPYLDRLERLEQEPIRARLEKAGITIPTEHLKNLNTGDAMLTLEGKQWANRAMRRFREGRIEFWSKIALPIVSLIVAIIALFLSSRR